ncbi:uncharacterized protein TNCV_3087811 [Trichonephila clavipes]|uniref:Uncharacterized protein n=1 Tax=Trichonephila clavipes TaxID=2585209 RepID=A0A8X6RKY7_TRICX|nr:uncharacterized protein TNCV_3087811 [Trichonephila clavipes]
MKPRTMTPAVRAVFRYKANAALRRLPRGLHTRTRLSSLLRLNLGSSLNTTWFYFAAVQFPRARHNFKWRRQWLILAEREPSLPQLKRSRENGKSPKWMFKTLVPEL